MEEQKLHEKTKERVLEDIEKLLNKSELAPAEYKALTDAYCLLEKIKKVQDDGYESSYSETGGSYRRGRSHRTGRYMSMDHGASHHSANDKLIHALEDLLGEAENGYEYEMYSEWLNKAKSN